MSPKKLSTPKPTSWWWFKLGYIPGYSTPNPLVYFHLSLFPSPLKSLQLMLWLLHSPNRSLFWPQDAGGTKGSRIPIFVELMFQLGKEQQSDTSAFKGMACAGENSKTRYGHKRRWESSLLGKKAEFGSLSEEEVFEQTSE